MNVTEENLKQEDHVKNREYRTIVLDKIHKIFHYGDKNKQLKIAEYVFPWDIMYSDSKESREKDILKKMATKKAILNVSNNILRLIAIFIICKYKKWYEANGSKNNNRSAKYNSDERVVKVLKNLFHQFDLNYDIMQFIILNTQIALDKDKSVFDLIGLDDKLAISGVATRNGIKGGNKDYISGPNLVDCMLSVQTYCKILSYDFGSRDLDSKFTMTSLYENLIQLLNACDTIKYNDIEVEKDGTVKFVDIYDENDQISSYNILRVVEENGNQQLLYLSAIKKLEDKHILLLEYKNLNDSGDSYRYFVTDKVYNDKFNDDKPRRMLECDSIENLYLGITGHILGNRRNAYGKSGILSYNYKYINQLSLAIVDSIESSEHRDCRINLKSLILRNKEFFKDEIILAKLDDNDEDNDEYDALNWDMVLTKLLTFESPTRVLKTLLKEEDGTCLEIIDKIIINLNVRLQNSFDTNLTFDRRDQMLKDLKKQLVIFNEGKDLVEDSFRKKWENHLKLDATIRSLVDELSNINEGSKSNVIYTNSIYEKITFLSTMQEYNKGSHHRADEIKTTCDNILCEIIKTMLCFYSGVAGAVKPRLGYETESFNKYLNNKEIKEHQQRIEEAFIKEIARRAQELSKFTSPKEFLIELTKKAEQSLENNSDDVKAIKAILGRNILNLRQLKGIVNYTDGEVYLICYDDNVRHEINVDNVEKHEVPYYLSAVKTLLNFLAGERNDYTQIEKFRNMIYPAIATFSGNIVNRDRNSLMKFSLIIDDGTIVRSTDATTDGKPASQRLNEVNISTEFEYQINEKFYCLPNIDRITGQLWADPILIQCDKFNKALENNLD